MLNPSHINLFNFSLYWGVLFSSLIRCNRLRSQMCALVACPDVHGETTPTTANYHKSMFDFHGADSPSPRRLDGFIMPPNGSNVHLTCCVSIRWPGHPTIVGIIYFNEYIDISYRDLPFWISYINPMEYLTASLYLPCDDIIPFPWPGRLQLLDLGPLTSLNFESRCFRFVRGDTFD